MEYLLKGILIGLLFGLPAGAVGALTVQRTFTIGVKAGLLTGLGSSAADCLYACVGVFGLTVISDFLLSHQAVINVLGGGLVLIYGIGLLLRKKEETEEKQSSTAPVAMFLSSFAVGITNPTAVLTFLFAFSYFEISGNAGAGQGISLICGVFTGTYIWWICLTAVTEIFRSRSKRFALTRMNRVFGSILCLFGISVFVRTLWNSLVG